MFIGRKYSENNQYVQIYEVFFCENYNFMEGNGEKKSFCGCLGLPIYLSDHQRWSKQPQREKGL